MKILSSLLAVVLLAAGSGMAATKVVELPPMPAKPPGSSAILLGTEAVQKELKLTSLQRAVINDIRNDYREEAQALARKVVAGKETRKKALSDLDALTVSAERRALRSLNGEQKKRIEEIRFQLLGGYMLLTPALQAKLGLDGKQRAAIEKIWTRGETYVAKVNAWYEQGKISLNQRLLYLRENRLDRSDDFVALLTSDQFAMFEKLSGEKFSG